jgi:hypothetical protein
MKNLLFFKIILSLSVFLLILSFVFDYANYFKSTNDLQTVISNFTDPIDNMQIIYCLNNKMIDDRDKDKSFDSVKTIESLFEILKK